MSHATPCGLTSGPLLWRQVAASGTCSVKSHLLRRPFALRLRQDYEASEGRLMISLATPLKSTPLDCLLQLESLCLEGPYHFCFSK